MAKLINRSHQNRKPDSWPRWRHRWTHCASSHNQKDNNEFKHKNQPELTENRTVWKSDNQGVKEETLTQTGRGGGDGQLGGEASWQGGGWQSGRSHIHLRINWEEQLGTRHISQPRVPAGKIKPQTSD